MELDKSDYHEPINNTSTSMMNVRAPRPSSRYRLSLLKRTAIRIHGYMHDMLHWLRTYDPRVTCTLIPAIIPQKREANDERNQSAHHGFKPFPQSNTTRADSHDRLAAGTCDLGTSSRIRSQKWFPCFSNGSSNHRMSANMESTLEEYKPLLSSETARNHPASRFFSQLVCVPHLASRAVARTPAHPTLKVTRPVSYDKR